MPRPEPPGDPALAAVEGYLAGLTPAAPAIGRDRLLYEAGRRSVRTGRGWPAATVLFAGLAATLAVRDVTRPESPAQVVERVVYLPAADTETRRHGDTETRRQEGNEPEPESGSSVSLSPLLLVSLSAPNGDYLRLRDRALRFGVDALPDPPPVRGWPTAPLEGAFALSRAVTP